MDEIVKKWGTERFYISCHYSCTISFLVKIYIKYAWILIMKKQNSNENVKVEEMVVFCQNFWPLSSQVSFGNFSCPVKLWKSLKLKFRSKFNHGFTNHGYLHSPVWKDSYNIKVKRAQEARDNQFLFQNVQNNEIFEIFKMFKNNRWINIYYTKSKRF